MADIKLHTLKGRSMDDMMLEGPKSLPTLTIRSEDMPEVADWKNGETYEIRAIVKQKRSDEDSVTLEIKKVGGRPKRSKERRVSRMT